MSDAVVVSTDPMIQEWFDVYMTYLKFFRPEVKERDLMVIWSEHTNSMIDYYHNTSETWHEDFVLFLRCQIDYYKRQNEHIQHVGIDKLKITPSNGGRYWK